MSKSWIYNQFLSTTKFIVSVNKSVLVCIDFQAFWKGRDSNYSVVVAGQVAGGHQAQRAHVPARSHRLHHIRQHSQPSHLFPGLFIKSNDSFSSWCWRHAWLVGWSDLALLAIFENGHYSILPIRYILKSPIPKNWIFVSENFKYLPFTSKNSRQKENPIFYFVLCS